MFKLELGFIYGVLFILLVYYLAKIIYNYGLKKGRKEVKK